MEFEDKQIYYVSSINRTSGTSSDFSYTFDLSGNNYDNVVILAVSIPKSYYLVASYNDEFTLVENNQSIIIKVPEGNYTLTAFKQVLTQLLNTYSLNNWVYSISFPSVNETNTGKLTYTVSGNGIIQTQFIFSEYLYQQMGFNKGTYTFVNNTLTSTNIIYLQLLNALFIHSDVANNKRDSVLQEVYSNNDDFSNITYRAYCPAAYSKKMSYNNGGVYRFYLTDTYNNLINLNGLDWNFTIMFYKQNNTLDLIKTYMKYTLLKQ